MAKSGVRVVGNLGAKPTLKKTENSQVANMSVRVEQVRPVEKDGETEYVDAGSFWQTVEIWGKGAANAERLLDAGYPVVVTGRLVDDSYTPEGASSPVSRTKVKADSVALDLTDRILGIDIRAPKGNT